MTFTPTPHSATAATTIRDVARDSWSVFVPHFRVDPQLYHPQDLLSGAAKVESSMINLPNSWLIRIADGESFSGGNAGQTHERVMNGFADWMARQRPTIQRLEADDNNRSFMVKVNSMGTSGLTRMPVRFLTDSGSALTDADHTLSTMFGEDLDHVRAAVVTCRVYCGGGNIDVQFLVSPEQEIHDGFIEGAIPAASLPRRERIETFSAE